jgi:hypothetical protein
MAIGVPVNEADHDLAARGGGAELEEFGERIAPWAWWQRAPLPRASIPAAVATATRW